MHEFNRRLKMEKHSVNYVSFAKVFFFFIRGFPNTAVCYNFTLCGFVFFFFYFTPKITPTTKRKKYAKIKKIK